MATNTYVALQTVTASSASTVSFTSIPSTYTDLRIVAVGISSTTGSSVNNWRMTFNGDSTSGLYSNTALYGNGSTASSNRDSNGNFMYLGLVGQASNTAQPVSTFDIMNYSNNTTNKTVLSRGSSASDSTYAMVGLWRNTAVINRVDLFMSGATVTGTFTIYGIKNWTAETGTKATGGEVFYDSTYCYHVFKYSGNFIPSQSLTADFMMVGGGGGTGNAGGGAGGFRLLTSQSFTATTYPVVVGAGGVGTGYNGGGTAAVSNGTSTTFYGTTATYGGGGGNQTNNTDADGQPGGSGGGEGYGRSQGLGASDTAGTGNLGGFTPVEGYGGGMGKSDNSTYTLGGGGGGAGGVGGTVSSNTGIGGAGGIGAGGTSYTNYTIINAMGAATNTGELSSGNYYYAGGGSAYGPSGPTTGGLGGGGRSATGSYGSPTVYSGLPNTGGGGGGANSDAKGGRGGSGVVIIRYPK